MLEFVCLPWSEVCSARVTSLLLLLLLLKVEISGTRSGLGRGRAGAGQGGRAGAEARQGQGQGQVRAEVRGRQGQQGGAGRRRRQGAHQTLKPEPRQAVFCCLQAELCGSSEVWLGSLVLCVWTHSSPASRAPRTTPIFEGQHSGWGMTSGPPGTASSS